MKKTALALMATLILTACQTSETGEKPAYSGLPVFSPPPSSPTGSPSAGPAQVPPPEKKFPFYEEPDPGEDDGLVWIPKFQLPAGAVTSGWSDFLVIVPDGKQDIRIEIKRVNRPWQDRPLNLLRDDLYNLRYCPPEIKDNPLIDCSRGFEKGQLTMAGHELYYVRYWSRERDPAAEEVREIVFQAKNYPAWLTVQGDFVVARPALEKMIATLAFVNEVYTPKAAD